MFWCDSQTHLLALRLAPFFSLSLSQDRLWFTNMKFRFYKFFMLPLAYSDCAPQLPVHGVSSVAEVYNKICRVCSLLQYFLALIS